MRGKIRRPSGDWQIPEADDLVPVGMPVICLPWNVILPLRGRISPEIVRSVVDFPAPLEPISVTISPSWTSKERPFTAAMLP